MKKLLILASALALTGCVVAPPAPANYGTRGAQYQGDPSQWRVVSVTPVPNGTGERMAANGGSQVEYTNAPTVAYTPQPVYVQQPVYVPQPVYAPAPAYYYDTAPINFSIGLGLGYVFGHHWGGHGYYHRGYHR
jgi:hypothetical protein